MTVEYSPIKWVTADIERSPYLFRIRVLNEDERKENGVDYPIAKISIWELGQNIDGPPGPYKYRKKVDMLINIEDLIELGKGLQQLPEEGVEK